MTKIEAITFLKYQRELGDPIRDHQRKAFIAMMYLDQFDSGFQGACWKMVRL